MKTTIFSLGGSIIIPGEINVSFLKEFRTLILEMTQREERAVIVCGGGSINTKYNNAAKEIAPAAKDDLDWLGIACTKVNSQFIRTIFGEVAYEKIVDNPTDKIKTDKKIIIASGWKPGFSSDNDAILLAKNLGSKLVINLTNISHVCDKDPKKFKDAKELKKLSWMDYLKIVGTEWTPRMNVPFDPIAAKNALENGIRVAILKGTDMKNLKRFLAEKEFEGTTIE
jgi:uridylate kinase